MCEILTLSPDFVASYLRDLVVPVWIGLSDRLHEGRFAWSDGVNPVLYTNWADKEPNNADGEVRNYCCLVSEPKSWEEAQQACVKEGGNLASVDMSYDQAFISGAVQQGETDAWIGLRRLAGSDSYKWSDGWPVFFTHWGPGEPTDHEGEGCVSMHAPSLFIQGTWNDTACAATKPYICKITKGKADQATDKRQAQTLKPFLSRHDTAHTQNTQHTHTVQSRDRKTHPVQNWTADSMPCF
uniref:C-type lectin domain-containing protein n=1 Tax=Sinocyclocheilus rhinocerous TaxID=307959 RepID=A0A673HA46_9TELE